MGTSLSNMHLYVEGQSGAEHYERVIAGLEAAMREQGFQSATSENAERSIRIAFEENSPWITFYQGDLTQKLPDLPKQLSQAGFPAVEIEVWDSDVLQMQLFRAGRKIDLFSDWANYDQHPRRRKGNAARWSKALPAVPSAAELQAAWTPQKADYPFESEGALYRVLDLLKIDRWRLWLGEASEQIPSTAQVTELHFRYAQGNPYDRLAIGLPMFRWSTYSGIAETTIGKEYTASFCVMNLGGESIGLEIDLQGEAIDKSLVEPIGLISERPFDFPFGKIVSVPIKQMGANGRITFHFELPTKSLPAGITDWDKIHTFPPYQRDAQRDAEFMYRIGMAVVLKPVQPGTGQLVTRISPLENPTASVEFITEVKVNR